MTKEECNSTYEFSYIATAEVTLKHGLGNEEIRNSLQSTNS
jgi:hypothetical protein